MMSDNQPSRAERLEAILRDLIRAAHSFMEFTKEHEIARTDEWRDLSTATYEAASDASNLRSGSAAT
jgi:hypothetical protein